MASAKGWQRILVAVFGLLPALLLCVAFVPFAVGGLWDAPARGEFLAPLLFLASVALVWGTVSLLLVVTGSSVESTRHGLAAGVIGIVVLSGRTIAFGSGWAFAIVVWAFGPFLVSLLLFAQAALGRGRQYALVTLRRAGLAVALAIAVITAAPSAAVWWYGRDFQGNVVDAAAAVSPDGDYCIFDDDRKILVTRFDELDLDRILRRAFYSSLAHSRVDASRWRDHHFRLLVDEETYYWSFDEAAFKTESRTGFQLRDSMSKLCGNYLSYPETYRSTFRARFPDLELSEANFCCPSVGAAEITL